MQRLVKQFYTAITVVALSASISACQRPASLYSLTRDETNIAQQLTIQGIHTIHIDNTLRLILPSDLFFIAPTATIKDDQVATLQRVAQMIRQFPHTTITITGYSDHVLSNQQAKKLSRAQAQAIAGFLWNAGILESNMRVIGKGYTAPQNTEHNPKAAAQNRRVEISLSTNN